MHWSARFLDWRSSREGACWQFFRHVQREQFGRELPEVMVPEGLRQLAQAIRSGAKEYGWAAVDQPQTGDGVVMGRASHGTHIGVYVGDLPRPHVLHCDGAVVALHDFTHLDLARWRWRGFWRPVEMEAEGGKWAY